MVSWVRSAGVLPGINGTSTNCANKISKTETLTKGAGGRMTQTIEAHIKIRLLFRTARLI